MSESNENPVFGLNEAERTIETRFFTNLSAFNCSPVRAGRPSQLVWVLQGRNWVNGYSVEVMFTDPATDGGLGTIVEVGRSKYVIIAGADALVKNRDKLEALRTGKCSSLTLQLSARFTEYYGGLLKELELMDPPFAVNECRDGADGVDKNVAEAIDKAVTAAVDKAVTEAIAKRDSDIRGLG